MGSLVGLATGLWSVVLHVLPQFAECDLLMRSYASFVGPVLYTDSEYLLRCPVLTMACFSLLQFEGSLVVRVCISAVAVVAVAIFCIRYVAVEGRRN